MRYTNIMVCPQCGEQIKVIIDYFCISKSELIYLRDRPNIVQICNHNVNDYVLNECNELYPPQIKKPTY